MDELKPCPKCKSRCLCKGVPFKAGTQKLIIKIRALHGVTCLNCGYHKATARSWNRRAGEDG